MKSRRAADSLADGFEPAALPPPGPDGSIDLSSLQLATATEPPPRICEYGPCRHYHTFRIVMDAQKAIGQEDASPDRLERQHWCYPDTGIEMDLGATPVVECNRWKPQGLITIGIRRRFRRDRLVWETQQLTARLAEQAAITEAETDAQNALADAEAARAAAPASTPSPEGTPAA